MTKFFNLLTQLTIGVSLFYPGNSCFAAQNDRLFEHEGGRAVSMMNEDDSRQFFKKIDEKKVTQISEIVSNLTGNLYSQRSQYILPNSNMDRQLQNLENQKENINYEQRGGHYFSLSGYITGEYSKMLKAKAVECYISAAKEAHPLTQYFIGDFGVILQDFSKRFEGEESKPIHELSIDLFNLARQQNPKDRSRQKVYESAVADYADQFGEEYPKEDKMNLGKRSRRSSDEPTQDQSTSTEDLEFLEDGSKPQKKLSLSTTKQESLSHSSSMKIEKQS